MSDWAAKNVRLIGINLLAAYGPGSAPKIWRGDSEG